MQKDRLIEARYRGKAFKTAMKTASEAAHEADTSSSVKGDNGIHAGDL